MLLVVVRGLAVRADLAGRGRPRVRALHALPRGETLGELDAQVERLARLGGPLRGRVWVLTDEVLARTLELEARAARGLSAEHLDRALAFEAQVYSGIASADAVTAWRALGERSARRRFLVEQVHASDLAAVKAAIEEAGGRFAGLLHPGGVPRRLAAEGERLGAFARVETWSDVRVRVERAAGGALSLEFGAEFDPERDAGERETLAVERGTAELALEDESVRERWLEAWGEVLAAREPVVPVLVAPRAPISTARLTWSGAALSLLVAAAACTDRPALLRQLAGARGEGASLQAALDVFAANRNAMTGLRRELEQLAAEGPSESAAGARWSVELPPRVLAVLAEQRPAGVLLEELTLDWQGSRLRGVAVGGAPLDALATILTRALAGSGYEASLARRALRDDGLFAFELVVGRAGRPVAARGGDEG
jgi:hypothetical protein